MSEKNEVKKIPDAGIGEKVLNLVERLGNKLPDPAILFLISLLSVWILSALLSPVVFSEIDPRTKEPLKIVNLLSGESLVAFLSNMVTVFTGFVPLGVVLVAVLGVGIAEQSGYVNTGLKLLMKITPKKLLTPMVILVAIVSHTAVDSGYVIVIPLSGLIFYTAGRHPLAGIAAAFAGVSGGFGANFVPSGIDPLLQGFTQSAARIIDPEIMVNPLNNWYFTAFSSVLIIFLGWFITDRIIEPRLNSKFRYESAGETESDMSTITPKEKKAFYLSSLLMLNMVILLVVTSMGSDSPWRDKDGNISSFNAPLMKSIVPLIFLIFALPGTAYGYISGSFKKSKDVIMAMAKSMNGMSYYIVMAFFCALFIDAFSKSNLGALLALKGAEILKQLALPGQLTIIGMILLTALVNIFVGSASAKWALMSPIIVPMLMGLGISPDLTQAAYRIGDSSTNIITPLLVYMPLIVVFAQKYVKETGIGTLISIMLPYSITFIIGWTIFLLVYWTLGIPLGIQAVYTYTP